MITVEARPFRNFECKQSGTTGAMIGMEEAGIVIEIILSSRPVPCHDEKIDVLFKETIDISEEMAAHFQKEILAKFEEILSRKR